MVKRKVTRKSAKPSTTTKANKELSSGDAHEILLAELTELEISQEEREQMIAEAAYYRAQKRGFINSSSDEFADWIEAEKIVDNMLKRAVTKQADPAHESG